MDEMLVPWIKKWQKMGYDVIMTSDHGQDNRGHHGGSNSMQQEFALYYFGDAIFSGRKDVSLNQLQLAPTILSLMGTKIPVTTLGCPFLEDKIVL